MPVSFFHYDAHLKNAPRSNTDGRFSRSNRSTQESKGNYLYRSNFIASIFTLLYNASGYMFTLPLP